VVHHDAAPVIEVGYHGNNSRATTCSSGIGFGGRYFYQKYHSEMNTDLLEPSMQEHCAAAEQFSEIHR
jgi:hypothetical protein